MIYRNDCKLKRWIWKQCSNYMKSCDESDGSSVPIQGLWTSVFIVIRAIFNQGSGLELAMFKPRNLHRTLTNIPKVDPLISHNFIKVIYLTILIKNKFKGENTGDHFSCFFSCYIICWKTVRLELLENNS